MELTIEHLAPYLPYRPEIYGANDFFPVIGLDTNGVEVDTPFGRGGIDFDQIGVEYWLLLRPLSQLTEEIEHGGERFVPLNKLNKDFAWDEVYLVNYANSGLGWHIDFSFANTAIPFQNNYHVIQELFEWHLDVFGLIDNGLAIKKE